MQPVHHGFIGGETNAISFRQRLSVDRPGHGPPRSQESDAVPAVRCDLQADHFGDMQARNGKFSGDLFEYDVGGVVGADVEVGAGVGDLAHALGQVFSDRGIIFRLPSGHAEPHGQRAHYHGGMHMGAEALGSLPACGEKTKRCTFGTVRCNSNRLHYFCSFTRLALLVRPHTTYSGHGSGQEVAGVRDAWSKAKFLTAGSGAGQSDNRGSAFFIAQFVAVLR